MRWFILRRCLFGPALSDTAYGPEKNADLKEYQLFSEAICGAKDELTKQKKSELTNWKDALAGLKNVQCVFYACICGPRCRSPPGLFFIFAF